VWIEGDPGYVALDDIQLDERCLTNHFSDDDVTEKGGAASAL
jgi:hypothetical protein